MNDRVARFDPDTVTTVNATAERDPAEAGLSRDAVDAIWRAAVAFYETRHQPAIALCLRRRGVVVLDRAIGHARGNSPQSSADAVKVRATPDTLFNLFSASKAVTAMVAHLLDQRGLIHLDDPVATFIPEFGRHEKEHITVRHLLTHRAGIPLIRHDEISPDLIADHDRVIAHLCGERPASRAGRRLAYHALTSGYLLAEVVRRVTGRDIRTYLRDEVLAPLGFRHFNYGVSPEDVPRVAEDAFTGSPPPFLVNWMFRRSLGVDYDAPPRLTNDPRFLTAIVPSGNIIGTANEASRFFQMLLNGGELDGVRVFEARTVRRAVAEQTHLEFDQTLGMPVRYSMGFMLGRRFASLYGPDTPHAFGHLGYTCVVAWADPERAIACGLMATGKMCVTSAWFAWRRLMAEIGRRCAPRNN